MVQSSEAEIGARNWSICDREEGAKFKELTIEFKELTYKVFDKEAPPVSDRYKTILHGISGIFKPGELTCILGPSGSGKTTMLNILAGYRTENVTGQVLIDGCRRELLSFRKMSCYLLQDVALLEQLTTEESMGFAAKLKLPYKTQAERHTKVSEILEMIGLTDCLATKVSLLSGGEKKRLAIALELITNPPVMFFDEPTTGLDSSLALNCIKLLKELATNGRRTIIATIHQPSSKIFEMFDSMYLLSQGHCLYSGSRNQFVPYLANQNINCPFTYNPADFAIEIASFEYGSNLVETLNKSERLGLEYSTSEMMTFKDVSAISEIDSSCRFGTQFLVLLHRSFVCIRRDFMLTHARFLASICIAVFLGLIFPDVGNDADKTFSNTFAIFFGILYQLLFAMLLTVLTFPLEREAIIREHMNSWYSIKSYYFGRSLADLPFQLFYPTLFASITYFMTGQPMETFRFNYFLLISILLALIGQSYGMIIGATFDVQSAVYIAPISILPLLLLTCVFGSLSSAPAFIRVISWISYPRFATRALLYTLYGFGREPLPCSKPLCLFRNPEEFLKLMEMADVNVTLQIVYLCITLIMFRIIAFLALKRAMRKATE